MVLILSLRQCQARIQEGTLTMLPTYVKRFDFSSLGRGMPASLPAIKGVQAFVSHPDKEPVIIDVFLLDVRENGFFSRGQV